MVEREFPGKLLKMSVYQYTRVPPNVTRPRRNVIVDFAPIEADYSRPITGSVDGNTVEIRRDISGWGEIASEQGLLVFGCMANFTGDFVPDAFVERALALWNRATEAVKDDPACAYNVRMGRMSVVCLLLMRQRLRMSVQSKEYPDARIRALAKEMLATVEIAKKAGRPASFAEGGYRPRGVDGNLVQSGIGSKGAVTRKANPNLQSVE